MDERRLSEILTRFEGTRVLVLGDYFLDKYLDISRSLAETSLETGLEAHQVVGMRPSPGAAGNVAANLSALGVQVTALGVIGDDGEGYDLLDALRVRELNVAHMLQTRERVTPTYTKPMMHGPDGRVHELSRLDILNRTPLPLAQEDALVERMRCLLPQVDGLVVVDQVPQRNCGVVTDRVRDALLDLSGRHPDVVVTVDSRQRIGELRNVVLKPNEHEAMRAVEPEHTGPISLADARAAGEALQRRSGGTVYVTVGSAGILLCTGADCRRVAAVPISGPIDIVGAGDSTLAGITAGLCGGAEPAEAALLGNLVASVTIRCLGTTGTASQDEVQEAFRAWRADPGAVLG